LIDDDVLIDAGFHCGYRRSLRRALDDLTHAKFLVLFGGDESGKSFIF
jgi:hypothetical protein